MERSVARRPLLVEEEKCGARSDPAGPVADRVARIKPGPASLGWDEPEAGDVTEAIAAGHEAAGTGPGAQVSPGDRGPTVR